MLLHAADASVTHSLMVVRSLGTDVCVLCMSLVEDIECLELWLRTGVKAKLRYIPCHVIADVLGLDLCQASMSLLAVT